LELGSSKNKAPDLLNIAKPSFSLCFIPEEKFLIILSFACSK